MLNIEQCTTMQLNNVTKVADTRQFYFLENEIRSQGKEVPWLICWQQHRLCVWYLMRDGINPVSSLVSFHFLLLGFCSKEKKLTSLFLAYFSLMKPKQTHWPSLGEILSISTVRATKTWCGSRFLVAYHWKSHVVLVGTLIFLVACWNHIIIWYQNDHQIGWIASFWTVTSHHISPRACS